MAAVAVIAVTVMIQICFKSASVEVFFFFVNDANIWCRSFHVYAAKRKDQAQNEIKNKRPKKTKKQIKDRWELLIPASQRWKISPHESFCCGWFCLFMSSSAADFIEIWIFFGCLKKNLLNFQQTGMSTAEKWTSVLCLHFFFWVVSALALFSV